MSDLRPSAIFLHVGAKRTGKTTETLSMIADMYTRQGKPTLVFDIGNQSDFDEFISLKLDEVEHFNAIASSNHGFPFFRCNTIDIDTFFERVNRYVKNSNVVFEDSTSYMSSNLTGPKKRLVLNSRNLSNEYFFNLHSLGAASPDLYRYSEYMLLRQTNDDPNHLPAKLSSARPRIRQAMLDIRAENALLYPEEKAAKLASRLISLQGL